MKRVESIVLAAYKRTESILQEHIDKLHVVAKALVEREKIDANEFYALMDGKELPPLQSVEPKTDEKPADDENAQPEAQNAETQAQSADAPPRKARPCRANSPHRTKKKRPRSKLSRTILQRLTAVLTTRMHNEQKPDPLGSGCVFGKTDFERKILHERSFGSYPHPQKHQKV